MSTKKHVNVTFDDVGAEEIVNNSSVTAECLETDLQQLSQIGNKLASQFVFVFLHDVYDLLYFVMKHLKHVLFREGTFLEGIFQASKCLENGELQSINVL